MTNSVQRPLQHLQYAVLDDHFSFIGIILTESNKSHPRYIDADSVFSCFVINDHSIYWSFRKFLFTEGRQRLMRSCQLKMKSIHQLILLPVIWTAQLIYRWPWMVLGGLHVHFFLEFAFRVNYGFECLCVCKSLFVLYRSH